ncbi:tetratricopeptide repeat protein [Polynucleobacter sp. UB-Tiil-W10]|uniref:tetratricopeptide repeat protein n=1 Tax=Polynucleobacter sp. UB-Tiil-W10 TaxID=1855648 RepID=UPI001C0E3AD3|nr:tetratricopeptide repeat protein [Polynucleobacter sp. UB-Tiil-W10]MBU3540596.1 tetratricopeptide repeat protein [Polynucleobacter sp. UB-Tiil-W10]
MNSQYQLMLSQAIEAFQSGNTQSAEIILKRLLQVDAKNVPALHVLGLIRALQDNHVEAVKYLKKAVALEPSDPSLQYNLAKALSSIGNEKEALIHHQRVIKLMPQNPEAWLNYGKSLLALNRNEEAMATFNKALNIHAHYPEALLNKAIALRGLQKDDEALALINQALSLNVDFYEGWLNKAISLKALNQNDEALSCFDRAIKINPNKIDAWINVGNALLDLSRLQDALACFEKATDLDPKVAEYHIQQGKILQKIGNLTEASECFDRAIDLNPNNINAYICKSAVHMELKQFESALVCINKRISLNPNIADGYIDRGTALENLNRHTEARDCFKTALKIDPKNAQAKWGLTFNLIHKIPSSLNATNLMRQSFKDALSNLNQWLDESTLPNAHHAIGWRQPFYLAYQEINNRELIYQYGQICHRVMSWWSSRQNFSISAPNTRERIKVGIVSSHIYEHSVWNAIVKGWIQHLNPDLFEVHVFYLSSFSDYETILAKSIATSFTDNLDNLRDSVKAILEKEVDVLIYPEIGMSPLSCILANLRLAPLQLASWGHPETTGLATIDYFISAQEFEPTNAEDYYSEKLVQLPNLGCYYSARTESPININLQELGINAESPILLCPGTPFKYAPEHDQIFVSIAQKLSVCQFIFFQSQEVALSEALKERLENAFERENLNAADFIHFIPWQKTEAFYGLMLKADVFLDTIGFSGFNTAIQAIECGLPIVTREGHFLRGRLASGILRRMDMSELITNNETEYINLIVKLVQDRDYRKTVQEKIIVLRSILFDDLEPIRALEQFLIDRVKVGVDTSHLTNNN